MANLNGSLVGALVNGSPPLLAPPRFANGKDDILVRDTVLTAGNVIGDTVTLGTFKSTAFIDPAAMIWNDAFGVGATLNIGDANHPHGLANGVSIANAGSFNMHNSFTASMMGQPLWQKLGYASDPGGVLTLLATFEGANPSNANLAWKIAGRNE
jgi:hypothetical protein